MSFIARIAWQVRYAAICRGSQYQFGFREAWRESSASYEAWDDMRGDEPMPEPADAFDEDSYEWRFG